MTTAHELIKWNNEKRSKLTKENLLYYEEMLLYIRSSSSKLEQQTEEVLLELLEHVLQAQEEGRTAQEVFGNDPKAYCNELIGEIPNETRKERLRFAARITLYFLAVVSFMNGILGVGMYYLFGAGSDVTTFSIGSGSTIVILDLFILYAFIIVIFKWLKASAFKGEKPNKGLEYFLMALVGLLFGGLIIAVIVFVPDFGATVSIPTLTFTGIGILLYLMSGLFNKRSAVSSLFHLKKS